MRRDPPYSYTTLKTMLNRRGRCGIEDPDPPEARALTVDPNMGVADQINFLNQRPRRSGIKKQTYSRLHWKGTILRPHCPNLCVLSFSLWLSHHISLCLLSLSASKISRLAI
ncbi:hypothetical protein VNO78_00887 [Psophocarpus tetragonolobus]|uniref:Uncharacterized protein n=1 Tax=Psophocarpus tetragonolobus TaxID=3891 RepID=A0AAN9T9V7_PSOTE